MPTIKNGACFPLPPRVAALALLPALGACAAPVEETTEEPTEETVSSQAQAIVYPDSENKEDNAVGVLYSDLQLQHAQCTATLIAPRVVLTAAHCVVDIKTGRLAERAEFYENYFTENGYVGVPIPHPSFNRFTLENDLAVVRLDRDAGITPALLGGSSLPKYLPAAVNAVGYSPLTYSSTSNYLRQQQFAWASPQGSWFITDGAVTCKGDSGGPMLTLDHHEILGVGSWGDLPKEYGCSRTKSGYQRVDLLHSWIQDQVRAWDGGYGYRYFPRSAPTRIVDSRSGARLKGGAWYQLPVSASGVAANFTVTQPAGAGFLRVADCAMRDVHRASNLNFAPGATVAGLVTVGGSSVCFSSTVDAHVIVDMQGEFRHGYGAYGYNFFPYTSPIRRLDTRHGAEGIGRLRAGRTYRFYVGTSPVTLSLLALRPAANGHLTVTGCQPSAAGTSNLNFAAGQSIANSAIVVPDASGYVCVKSAADVDVVVDQLGRWSTTTSSTFVPVTARRIHDSRKDRGMLYPGEWRAFEFPQLSRYAALKVVSVGSTAPGGLIVSPCSFPGSAWNVAFDGRGTAVANHVMVNTGTSSSICIAATAPTHFVLDVEGYGQ